MTTRPAPWRDITQPAGTRLIVTVAETAILLQVSEQTIRDHIHTTLAAHGITRHLAIKRPLAGRPRSDHVLSATPLAEWVNGPGATIPGGHLEPLVWTPAQAARLLQMRVKPLQRRIAAGHFDPAIIRIGTCVRISRHQLTTHLAQPLDEVAS